MTQYPGEMRPLKSLISLHEAMNIIMDSIKPINKIETIALTEGVGRVLAEDIISQIDVPPFDRAAEDGYAIMAEDTFGANYQSPKTLKVIGSIDAGEVFDGRISKGECVQIATGAPIPEGANAVVRVEDTEKIGSNEIRVFRAVPPGFDVSPQGEDIKKGMPILKRGEVLTPSKIGVVAALGMDHVVVYSKPRVAIIPTGNEIIKPGERPLKPGEIYDVNSYTLTAATKIAGGEPHILGRCGDTIDEIHGYLEDIKNGYEIIVFSGGSSVGVRDLLIDAMKNYADVKFHGVAIKPGKPTWFALTGDNKAIFGMPGYPTSCLSDAYVFLIPAIRKAARLPMLRPQSVKAVMDQRINSSLGRAQFFTVKLQHGKAIPAFKTSGAITSMALADGYIMIPANTDLIDKGEEVEVYLFSSMEQQR